MENPSQIAQWFDEIRRKQIETGTLPLRGKQRTLDNYARESDWSGYPKGRHRPSKPRLDIVESALPGTKTVFDYGPGSMPIWTAVATDNALGLATIAKYGTRVDREIALIRLAAMNGWWDNHLELKSAVVTKDNNELIEGEFQKIWRNLIEITHPTPAQMILTRLGDELRQFAMRSSPKWDYKLPRERGSSPLNLSHIALDAVLSNIYFAGFSDLEKAIRYNTIGVNLGSDFVAHVGQTKADNGNKK